MNDLFCHELLQNLTSLSFDSEDMKPTYLTTAALNGFSSYTAIMFNIITIHAIRKTSSLPRALKTLLLSLAASDIGVGLLCQPFYVALVINRMQGNPRNCIIYTAFSILLSVFSIASFLGVMALIVDRFLAIYLHLRYQEIVTHKRVVSVVTSIWVFSVSFSLLLLWMPLSISSIILGVISIVCFTATAFFNYKIYSTVKSLANQVQPLQNQQIAQNTEIASIVRLKKSAIGTFYIYLVFLLCCLPHILGFGISIISGSSFATKHLFIFSTTLIFLNSSLNPLIYCWKMRHIRNTIMNLFRNFLLNTVINRN